jgi:hypothetical protein
LAGWEEEREGEVTEEEASQLLPSLLLVRLLVCARTVCVGIEEE